MKNITQVQWLYMNSKTKTSFIVDAQMFVKKAKDQAKYFTNFTKTDLTLYLKSKCEKEFGIYFTHKNWKKII